MLAEQNRSSEAWLMGKASSRNRLDCGPTGPTGPFISPMASDFWLDSELGCDTYTL
jgi:hypothetical protein